MKFNFKPTNSEKYIPMNDNQDIKPFSVTFEDESDDSEEFDLKDIEKYPGKDMSKKELEDFWNS